MIFSKKESLEDKVLRYLVSKERTVKSMKKELSSQGVEVSIQGIYKVLRSLIGQEIVIKRGSLYSLLEEWRNNTIDILSKSNNRLELTDGESIKLELSSLSHLDQQWKNIVLPLHESHPNEPIFFYNYHYIWLYVSESRKQSELAYFASFMKNKSYAFSLIGSKNIHDIEVKKILQNDFVEWAVGTERFPKTDYPVVFNDYVMITRLSKQLTEKIDRCYEESLNLVTLEAKLQKIGTEKNKVKLIIERNKNKAKKLRKKLSKEFFVPRNLIKEFDLY